MTYSTRKNKKVDNVWQLYIDIASLILDGTNS